MKGRIFAEDEGGSGDYCGGFADICVDGKVHLRKDYASYSQTGDEPNHYAYDRTIVLGACDGSCQHAIELDDQQQKLVEEFLATGKKGKVSSKTGPGHCSELEEATEPNKEKHYVQI